MTPVVYTCVSHHFFYSSLTFWNLYFSDCGGTTKKPNWTHLMEPSTQHQPTKRFLSLSLFLPFSPSEIVLTCNQTSPLLTLWFSRFYYLYWFFVCLFLVLVYFRFWCQFAHSQCCSSKMATMTRKLVLWSGHWMIPPKMTGIYSLWHDKWQDIHFLIILWSFIYFCAQIN